MSDLLAMWLANPKSLDSKAVKQILSFAGDGTLRDGNETCTAMREYLASVPSNLLSRYIGECLSEAFQGSGFVLQDLVNEIGSRLGFEVTHGLYRGRRGEIGYDGIWTAVDGHNLVVEVKTTDSYRINLDNIIRYRQQVAADGAFDLNRSSVLIVAGREDTGDLEAQIRGSRHAWDIRLMSVDALLKLLLIRENLNDDKTLQQIHRVLRPFEYTRIDGMIDVIFATAEDVREDSISAKEMNEHSKSDPILEPEQQANFHELCIRRITQRMGVPFVRQGRSSYTSADRSVHIVCIVSREYERRGHIRYWYSFHAAQQEFLETRERSYVALGCGTPKQIALLPKEVFLPTLATLRTTTSETRFYWHVEVFMRNQRFVLGTPNEHDGLDITEYFI